MDSTAGTEHNGVTSPIFQNQIEFCREQADRIDLCCSWLRAIVTLGNLNELQVTLICAEKLLPLAVVTCATVSVPTDYDNKEQISSAADMIEALTKRLLLEVMEKHAIVEHGRRSLNVEDVAKSTTPVPLRIS